MLLPPEPAHVEILVADNGAAGVVQHCVMVDVQVVGVAAAVVLGIGGLDVWPAEGPSRIVLCGFRGPCVVAGDACRVALQGVEAAHLEPL